MRIDIAPDLKNGVRLLTVLRDEKCATDLINQLVRDAIMREIKDGSVHADLFGEAVTKEQQA